MIYMGIYSPRPWTFADKQYKDNIPYAVKHARREQMNSLLKQLSAENNRKEIWTTRTMMVNEITEDWTLIWYTDNMKQIVATPTSNRQLWTILPVHITWASEFRLTGEI
jgi:tRNA A37 methylthiotransferase MiaB